MGKWRLIGRLKRFASTNAATLNFPHPLVDSHQRFHNYLRISLTEKCNLRCQYCMPEEGVPLNPLGKILTADEIIRIAGLFVRNGVDKIRLTGGEPTIRKDLVDIVGRLRSLSGVRDIGLTSNGIVLGRSLDSLVAAGLNRLNISLDTLREEKYLFITRRNGFPKVMSLIDKAEPMFDRLKINCVVMRGLNDDEIVDFVRLTENRNLDIRFIEYMPFGGNKFESRQLVPFKEMMKIIGAEFDNRVVRLADQPNDTSRAYKVDGFRGQFGFIASMSKPFCGSCNRLRITADGNLKVCLHGETEISLRDRIRAEATDAELLELIGEAVSRKKPQHADPQFSQKRHYSAEFSHLTPKGRMQMIDISAKSPTERTAMAVAAVDITAEILQQIRKRSLRKGDLGAVVRLSGIFAAKRTPDYIPLCHQIPLSNVEIRIFVDEIPNRIRIVGRVKTTAATGVEMEALTAVSVAALSLYDMCKAVTHQMTIGDIRVLGKRGGRRDFGSVGFESFENLEEI